MSMHEHDGLAGLAAREARMTEREAQALRDEFAGLAKEIRVAYQQGYADGGDDERAAMVAWLRGGAGLRGGECAEEWDDLWVAARDIERGDHRKK